MTKEHQLGCQNHWPGNAAKSFVIERILAETNGRVTILDHGCGRGGAWPTILARNPEMRLIAWDPHVESALAAQESLRGLSADVSIGVFPTGVRVDYVVSFSVFEHVRDRHAYLLQAKSALPPGGFFYLNYDDGHFRNALDPDEPKALRNFLRSRRRQHLYSRPRGTGEFQQRVTAEDAHRLVDDAGFTVAECWYHNLADFKWFARYIPPHQVEDFTDFWLTVEARLNRDFSVRLDSPLRGDTAALWQIAPSRTLLLQ